MKIRIGNDVRLNISVTLGNEVDYTNIQSMRVIFVNSSVAKNRFIGRFPIEPFSDEFTPDQYCVNSLGHPKYRAKIRNRYNGFGVYPDWNKCLPVEQPIAIEYQNRVVNIDNPQSVSVTFPAIAQKHVGIYDIIIIANIYDQSYEHGIRTTTVDVKNVFELVSSSQEADTVGPVQIDIDDNTTTSDVDDIFIVSGSYSNNDIRLRRNDNGVINIDVSSISGWYEGD